MSDEMTFCVHCGPNVKVDDDLCCSSCGSDAYGKGIEYIELLREESKQTSERCYKELESRDEQIESLRVELAEKDKRIEEQLSTIADLGDMLAEKDKRVEELEEIKAFYDYMDEMGEWIPKEKIDKAWNFARRHGYGHEMLGLMGIVACEECDGRGKWRMTSEKCPGCNGHGWVVSDE